MCQNFFFWKETKKGERRELKKLIIIIIYPRLLKRIKEKGGEKTKRNNINKEWRGGGGYGEICEVKSETKKE